MSGSTSDQPALIPFLNKFRVAKGSDFTHTSLGQPFGSFYIPHDNMAMFYSHYNEALKEGVDIHLTEKHRYISPICIDLDFRWTLSSCDPSIPRRYTYQDILVFCQVYVDELSKYVHIPQESKLCILEKKSGSVLNEVVKDGVHIMIPNIITKSSVQYIVRRNVVKHMENNGWHAALKLSNSMDDVFDEAVIEKNNWLMYGSKKPNGLPYEMTGIVEISTIDTDTAGACQNILTPCDVYDCSGNGMQYMDNIVQHLSLRNKFLESRTLEAKIDEIVEYENTELERRKAITSAKVIMSHNTENSDVQENLMVKDMDEIRSIVMILGSKRADNYNDWIRLGWCLRNIDNRLLPVWVEFSKKSKKYESGECEKRWSHMRRSGLGVGTLHMWAKTDSPELYGEMVRESLRNLIMNSLTGTHHDVAQVIHHMYKHEFVCSSIKSKAWYIFRNHRWQHTDSGYILRSRISNEVWYEFSNVSLYNQQKSMASDMQVDQQRYQEFAKKLIEVSQKLKNTTFKDNVMKECAELFYVEHFEEKLDANINLLGFENGVYDLDNQEFRDGRPEDYVSFSTRINYHPLNVDDPKVDEIYKYLAQVLTNYTVRDYVMKLFAMFLHGAIKDQKFYIWTGSGANSKSKLVELFERSFGDYCVKFPITLLTQKRVASNAANSEVARSRGKRFASLQEPSEDEKLNIGLMKELSGGDKIMARSLFKEPIEFAPQFKMLLLCNQLPHVPSDDGGTWRRIRVVEFTSKFTEDPKGENEFPIDLDLSKKLECWKECFMALLIEYYKKYAEEGIHEPEAVLKCTTEYKNQNDHISSYIADVLEPEADSFVSVTDVFAEFRSWVKSNGINARIPIKTEMEKILTKHFAVPATNQGGVRGFKGHRFKCHMMETDS